MTVAALRREGPRAGAVEPGRGRAELYALLSRAFSFPDEALHAELRDGRWAAELRASAERLPYPLKAGQAGIWMAPAAYDAFQSEYIRLFEMGQRGTAPCPLNSGHYARDRLKTMEELVRFYNFFGLRAVSGLMPDHVTVGLEFMHYLADQEAEGDRESCLRAERDFLPRHLAAWWPQLAERIKRERTVAFYRSAVRLAGAFFTADNRYLAGVQDA